MIQKPFAEMQTVFLMPGGDFPYPTYLRNKSPLPARWI